MSHLLARIYDSIAIVTDKSPLDPDEKLRLQHYTVFLSLGTPMMMVFALISLIKGELVLGGSVAVCVTGLIIGWALIRRGLNPVVIYRLDTALFAGLLLYLAALGGPDGSKILWTYPFPLIAFFLFGKREGWVWVVVTAVLLMTIVLRLAPLPGVHEYSSQFQVRYFFAFTLVAIFSYWFEYFREEYKSKMETEQAKLEEALTQVKALSGLLPICAACKKIRDDQGYWNQIESYIHAHSEARFSHGICPDCLHELYPEEADAADS
jgi:MASE6